MKNIKITIVYLILFSFLQHCSQIFSAEITAEKISTISIEVVAEKALEKLAASAPYIGVSVQAYNMAQEIRKHNFPTEEEKAHAFEVAEKYALLTAENEFQSCMIKNVNSSERGTLGRPTACEDIARLLIMVGGANQVNRMTTIYNQIRK